MSSPASFSEVIAAEGGEVTFARFMELALTHPVLGYYSRADRLLRQGGDFSTAPALSPFFNRTLARLVTELVEAALAADDRARFAEARATVVELGGGEGQLAAAILSFWETERPEFREQIAYRIVEVGPRLRERQAAAVRDFTARGWDVDWGAALPQACAGTRPAVVVGNEFVDTMPVHWVDVRGDALREAYVKASADGLEQTWKPASAPAGAEIELLFGTRDPGRLQSFTEDGTVEVFPGLAVLTRQVAETMPSGSLITIDYGEWFPGVPQTGEHWGLEGRAPRKRTVRGYFKHQIALAPLARAGRQDLTADVDFAALDLHGRREGFETVLFTNLAAFLRAGGAERELEELRIQVEGAGTGARTDAGDRLEADRQATVLRNLLDEQDLGGAFKLMVQVRDEEVAAQVAL